ncbi:MAG TPA: cell envelope integrity protein CreD [Thermoanaerobaculia bacterium]|jgi:inner membrane protein|nr:cell envelope integrity protein CreD [Thermoanaerobaculia bacterium]
MFETERPRRWRDSKLVKVMGVGILVLLLLIPLGMVGGLVAERQQRQLSVEQELAAVWGAAQTVAGPVLSIPYESLCEVQTTAANGQVVTSFQPCEKIAHFLPETLAVDGPVTPEVRSRGIFDVVVYRTDLRLQGTFAPPKFDEMARDAAVGAGPIGKIHWERASLGVGIPDLRGIRGRVDLDWQGQRVPFSPGVVDPSLWTAGLRAPLRLDVAAEKSAAGKPAAGGRIPFSFSVSLAGSSGLSLLPFGRQTRLALRSSWRSPSFSGAFLPESRRVGKDGFNATWNVSYYGRSFPQSWSSVQTGSLATAINGSAFGVDFVQPVDVYQQTERSVKYGALFLVLTFVTFFLFELFQPIRVHPVQYLMVGSALCLFYVLLLSIAEQLAFGIAYLIAAGATVTLLGAYAAAVLRGKKRAAVFGGVLGLLYAYLYVLLQAEDYALLLGSVGLFLILALVMLITRRVDWYGSGTAPVEAAIEGA